MLLTKKKIISDFNYFKNRANYYFKKNNIEKSVKYCTLAAVIGYRFCFKFYDDELENTVQNIGFKVLGNSIKFNREANKIIFFDSFAADNKVLTQQYLRAIFSWNYELLYVTTQKEIGKDILNELHTYKKSEILIIGGSSFTEKLKNTARAIQKFAPSITFLHFTPSDILGISLWSQIKSCDRFFVNLTDHSFWLGKNCLDYSLEFRKCGAVLSEKYRKILSPKILLQPYYPLLSTIPFQGFPVETKGKTIAFAGANYYKIFDKNLVFLNLIKEVLYQNDNLLFLFAGMGNDKPIRRFIKDNKLNDKFILIGHRDDIGEVIQKIDIYVNTYPVMGGLMCQYAANYRKPIIGFAEEKFLYSLQDAEGFLGVNQKEYFTKTNKELFICYFNDLIRNQNARKANIELTKNSVLTPEAFNLMLKQTIHQKQPIINNEYLKLKINVEIISEILLEVENYYLKDYYKNILIYLRFEAIIYKPIILLKCSRFILKNIITMLFKTFTKLAKIKCII